MTPEKIATTCLARFFQLLIQPKSIELFIHECNPAIDIQLRFNHVCNSHEIKFPAF